MSKGIEGTHKDIEEEKGSRGSAVNKKEAVEVDICFVLMPFGGWFDKYYEQIYKVAVEEAGLKAFRADDIYRPGTIINDVWELTKKSKIVIADLTDRNSNVLYELGLAHALAKPAIIITPAEELVPFDLRQLRLLIYNKDEPNWGDLLKDRISSSVKEILKSPIKSVLPTFMNVSEVEKNETTPLERELYKLKQQFEAFKRDVSSSAFSLKYPTESYKIVDSLQALATVSPGIKLSGGVEIGGFPQASAKVYEIQEGNDRSV